MITLGVSDLDRSVAFYRDGLGLPTRGDYPGVAFFPLAGTWLALYPRTDLAHDAVIEAGGSGFSGITLSHNVAERADVDRVLDEAVAAGATLLVAGRDMEWGGYAGHFADPDGFVWEVAWNPHLDLA